MKSWLAKVKRYGGGESVLSFYDTKELAQARVDRWNEEYQTNAAYVEKYDYEAEKSKAFGHTYTTTIPWMGKN